jgi:hypothetical protein
MKGCNTALIMLKARPLRKVLAVTVCRLFFLECSLARDSIAWLQRGAA